MNTEKQERTYALIVNETQANILISALDLLSRVGVGQWGDVIDHAPQQRYTNPEHDEVERVPIDMRHATKNLLSSVGSNFVGLLPHATLGLTNPHAPDAVRIAFDIQQVIEHRLAWDKNPEGYITNNFDKPMKWSEQPLPSIEAVDPQPKIPRLIQLLAQEMLPGREARLIVGEDGITRLEIYGRREVLETVLRNLADYYEGFTK
jgi:hypothetical protein